MLKPPPDVMKLPVNESATTSVTKLGDVDFIGRPICVPPTEVT